MKELTEELAVGQYLITVTQDNNYDIVPIYAEIIGVNKKTYRIRDCWGREDTISKSNLFSVYGYNKQKYLPVDKDKLTQDLIDGMRSYYNRIIIDVNQTKKLLGQAKFFLSQLDGLDIIEPPEEAYDEDNYYDDRYDDDYYYDDEDDDYDEDE